MAKERAELNVKLANREDAYQSTYKELLQLEKTLAETAQREQALFADKEILSIELRHLKDENLVLTERVHGLEQATQQQKLHFELERKNTADLHAAELNRQQAALQDFYANHDRLLQELKHQHQVEKHDLVLQQQLTREDLASEKKAHNEDVEAFQTLAIEFQNKQSELLAHLNDMKLELLTAASQSSDQYDKTLMMGMAVLEQTDAFSKRMRADFSNWETMLEKLSSTVSQREEGIVASMAKLSKILDEWRNNSQ